MPKTRISMIGVGSVIADIELGTLSPETLRVGQRLHIGFKCGDAKKNAKALSLKHVFVAEVIRRLGTPECGWHWIEPEPAATK